MSPDGQPGPVGKRLTPDAVSELAAGSIPEVIRTLPDANVRAAIAFHRWLDARLAELRDVPLSFVDADVPGGRVHEASARRLPAGRGDRGQ